MEKHIITHFEDTSPTTSNTVSAGYNIGQHWFNSATGIEYIHKSSGVWIEILSNIDAETQARIDGDDALQASIGDINTILDNINGEVI